MISNQTKGTGIMNRVLATAAVALALLTPVAAYAAEDDPYGDPTHAWAAHVPCNDPRL
jgi:hypothetical protein